MSDVATPLTTAELGEIEQEHPRKESLRPYCFQCSERWPCRSMRLVAMARRVVQFREHLRTCEWCDQVTACGGGRSILFPTAEATDV